MINIRKLEAELCESADMLHAGSKLRLQHRQPPAPLLHHIAEWNMAVVVVKLKRCAAVIIEHTRAFVNHTKILYIKY